MSGYYDKFKEFFVKDSWPFDELENQIIRTAFKGENGTYSCLAQSRDENHAVIFYAYSPREVPEVQKARMAEFVTRANYGLPHSAFEYDMDDGELRCRTGIRIELNDLTLDIIEKLVYSTIAVMERYYPAIAGVLLSQKSPKELAEAAEAGNG